jgi:hypothetical protein
VIPDLRPAADEVGRAASAVKTARTKPIRPARPNGPRRLANRADGEGTAAASRQFPARTKPNGEFAGNPGVEKSLVRRAGGSRPTNEPNLHEAPRPVVPSGAGVARVGAGWTIRRNGAISARTKPIALKSSAGGWQGVRRLRRFTQIEEKDRM